MSMNKRKRVTMDDIAKKLQISKNAVSLALNDKPGVSDTLRRQIRETAYQMNYDKLSDSGSTPSCIAVLVPEYIRNDSYFYSDIFWSIEHQIRKKGYTTLMLGLSKTEEQQCIMPSNPDSILSYLAIGIISGEYLTALNQSGKPIVSVDIHHYGLPISSVGSDNIGGAYTATRYLIQSGHTKIGFIGPVHVAQSVYERWCGFQQAMTEARLTEYNPYCILGANDHFELLDNAQVLSKYLSALPAFPTAWLCSGDLIAVSLLGLLKEREINVPDDISVMGFDNLKVSGMITPALTTINVDRDLIGRFAVQLLLDQTKEESLPIYTLSLSCNLIKRDSVSRPGRKEKP